MRKIANLHQMTWKISSRKYQSRKFMGLKFTEELYVVTMKNDAKCEEF